MKKFLLSIFALTCFACMAWAADATTYTSNVGIATPSGENASAVKVKIDNVEYDAIKVGTSKAGGSAVITVPANTTTLTLHAASWKGDSGLSLGITGATADPSSIDLTANDGVTGNPPFTITPNNNDEFFTINLTGVTEATKLTFTTGTTKKRFVMWGVNVEVTEPGTPGTDPGTEPGTNPSTPEFDPEVFATVVFDSNVTKGTTTGTSADEMSRGCITVSSTSAGLNYETYRIYASGATTTISSALPITKIVFTESETKYPASSFAVMEDNGEYDTTNNTWTGYSNSITFKPSAQVRLSKIEVDVDVTSFETPWTADEICFDRTLATPANWQALCLPFEVADWTDDMSEVIEYVDAENNEGTVTLNFKTLATTDPLEAGKPYLFKSKESAAKVGIIAENADVVAASSLQNVGTTYVFHGNFEAVTDMTAAYGLASDGNFHKGSATAVLKPFRAYITTASAAGAPAKLKVAVDGQEEAGLDEVIFFEGEDGATYNLKGIKVENPANGIVIRNGKKVFVK